MSARPPLTAPITGRYRHYKGNDYQVIGLGRHSETEEEFVVYHPVGKSDPLWLRPSTMFFETVMIDGIETPRFTPLGDTHG